MTIVTFRLTFALSLSVPVLFSTISHAQSPNERITFPDKYAEGVHYGTVKRGGIVEELFTSREAVDAAKTGSPFPEGTVIMMEDYRDGELYRYVAMEKRKSWEELSKAGFWLFREWDADGVPKSSEDGSRCQSCHISQENNDYVFTYQLMLDD